MRFLVDNSLSPRLAAELRTRGHDAIHLRERTRPDVPDEVVFELASVEDRVVPAQDTDLGTIVAARGTTKPSVVLIRRREKSTEAVLAALLLCIDRVASDLGADAVVVIEDERVRVRRLPIG